MAIDTAAKRRAASSARGRAFGRPYRTPSANSATHRARILGFFYGGVAPHGIGFGVFLSVTYAFIVEDVMSGQILGTLPLYDVQYEDYLNRPGLIRGKLPLKDADANVDLLDAGRRAIYVMRNGVIDQAGILQTPKVDVGASALALECVGWLGYWDRRDIWIDRQFTATDQFGIFKTLVDDAQDNAALGAGADLGIRVTWDTLSGVARDRLEDYRYFQGKNLGTALRELAACVDGFDFAMQYAINDAGDGITKTLKLYYPTKGTDHSSEQGFRYTRDKRTNVLDRGLQHDASTMAWRIRGWGGGADVSRLLSERINDSLRGVYPFYDGQYSGSSISEQSTLDENTEGALAARDHVISIPAIRPDSTKDPKWESYAIGDTWRVDMDDGYCSISGAFRIIGYKMDARTDTPDVYLQEA